MKAGRETSISVSQNQLSEEDRIKLKVSLQPPQSECVGRGHGQGGRRRRCRLTPQRPDTVLLLRLFLFLQDVAAVDGLYRIRVPRVLLQAERQAERQADGYLTTFVRAVCVFSLNDADFSPSAAAGLTLPPLSVLALASASGCFRAVKTTSGL